MPLKRRRNRSQPEPCPLANCMRLLGGAWTPNIIWHLEAGPRRFSELQCDIPKVSAKVLAERLRDLAKKELLTRSVQPTSPPSVEYALTDYGRQLLPAIAAIVKVGQKIKRQLAA